MKVPKWLQRWCLMRDYRRCHKIAETICCMGFDNFPTDAQKYLDNAKDDLYQAALSFKKEADKIK